MNDDQRKEDNVADMDPQATAAKIKQHPDLLVGVKTAHFGLPGWAAVERAVQAGRLANTPVMLDSHIYSNSGRNTREKVMNLMRPGDIHTHTYNDQQLELLNRFTRKVQPWMWEARARGVRFDLGHGGGSFLWPVARAAISQGFPPDTISTDLHPGSILTLQVNMPNAMSKLINLGMTVQDAVLRATVNPAKAIGRFPALATLGEGRTADVAAFELRTGVFAFIDSQRKKLTGTKELECVMTLRNGQVVFDRDARTYPPAAEAAVLAEAPLYPRPTPASQREAAVYDIVLKQGQVIDPANRRFGRYDVGITGTNIARIARWIPAANARLLVDVGDYHVTPGLVDIDAAVNFLDSPEAVQPDHRSLPHGVTTVADRNASQAIVRRSRTRVLPIGPTETVAGVVASRMNRRNVLSQHASMTRSLSLLLNAGTPLNEAIERATILPARAIARDDVGVLKEGGVADIAVFSLEQGEFPLIDSSNRRLIGKGKLICVLTVRNGAVVWDLHGLSMAEWSSSGAYSNYR
jgi:predicted amidohydrolase